MSENRRPQGGDFLTHTVVSVLMVQVQSVLFPSFIRQHINILE